MVRFFFLLSALALLLYVIIYEGNALGFFSTPSFDWEIILYMVLSTAVVYNILGRKSGPVLFTQLYLLTIVIKMLAGSIFIFIVIFIDHSGASANAILFIISYIFFTALEVGFLYRKVSKSQS